MLALRFVLVISLLVAIVKSTPSVESDFNAIFSDVDAVVRQANYEALADAMFTMNVSFASDTQVAIFLGTLKHNTRSLHYRQADCAVQGTCPEFYNTHCNDKIDNRTYYPRSGMMVAYKCGYETVNRIIQSRSVVAVADIMPNPAIIADNLYYSYLASLAVWVDTDSNGTSCLSSTQNTTGLLSCIDRINPWECTNSGLHDKAAHAESIAGAFSAIGMQIGSDEIASAMCPNNGSDVASATTAPALDICNNTNASTVAPESPTTMPCQCVVLNATAEPNAEPTTGATVDPACTTAPTTSPTCDTSFPFVDNMLDSRACNAVSFDEFSLMFPNASNATAHFNAFAGACNLSGINMTANEASFFLGMLSTTTSNLTGNPGTMLKTTPDVNFTNFTAAAGLQCGNSSSLTPLIGDNMLISYMAGLYMMKSSSFAGLTTMQAANRMQFGWAMKSLNDHYCPSTSAQTKILGEVKRASDIIGQPIPSDVLQLSMCSDDDDVESSSLKIVPAVMTFMAILLTLAL